MEDVLARMKDDKRIRLINSAMKEFGTNRFDKASTNVIVREANISKGLLYHYFETKEALFDHLRAFTMKSMGKAIVDSVEWDDGDLINRMQRVIEIKLRILEQYPYMLDFGKIMYESKSVDEVKKIADKYTPDIYLKVYSHNINYALFKDNLDVSRAIKMIQLFLDGYSEQLLQKYKTVISSTKELKKKWMK
jgi:AcrR family transcriptional regulator